MSDSKRQLPAKVVLEGQVARRFSELTIKIELRPGTIEQMEAALKAVKEQLRSMPSVVRTVQPWERKAFDDCIDGQSEAQP